MSIPVNAGVTSFVLCILFLSFLTLQFGKNQGCMGWRKKWKSVVLELKVSRRFQERRGLSKWQGSYRREGKSKKGRR